MNQSTEIGGGGEARQKNTTALLDAAESLLVRVGYSGVTSRALAKEARVNNGLVHYYFGSMDDVFTHVIERMIDQLVERQHAAYTGTLPLAEKWRAAWCKAELESERHQSKLHLELCAMAWNKPSFQTQLNQLAAIRELWQMRTQSRRRS